MVWIATALLLLFGLGIGVLLVLVLQQQGRTLLRLDDLEHGLAELSESFEPEELEPPVIGLPVGEGLPSFTLRDLGGERRRLEDFAGKRALLVNWDPACGFCELIAPDLARLQPDLRKRGVELVLLAHGDLKANRSFAAAHGLDCTILRGDAPDFFATLGTPVAYLLDADRRVAEPMAAGADEVLELARVAGGSRRRLRTERSLSDTRLEREGLRAGTPAPSFALPDIHGKTITLEEYRGRKVLLVFSDPDCGPCEQLGPELADLHRAHRGNNLQVLMVGRGDVAENRRKAREHGLDFPVVVQKRWKLSKEYGIFATPVAFLIDENGVIARDVAQGADEILALAGEVK